jgi:hypothetical protein
MVVAVAIVTANSIIINFLIGVLFKFGGKTGEIEKGLTLLNIFLKKHAEGKGSHRSADFQ